MEDKEEKGRDDHWRILAHGKNGERFELEKEGVFDELAIDDWLHLEQVDDEVWWARIGDVRVVTSVQV